LVLQPTQNLNWTGFIRADYRTGCNIYGAAVTAGLRYQFSQGWRYESLNLVVMQRRMA
jgi:hypothetical protein